MDTPTAITDKTHPIEITCVAIYAVIFAPLVSLFLAPFIWIVFSPFIFLLYHKITGFMVFYAIGIIAAIALIILSAKNIHYEFNEQFVIYRKGIISKSERHIPYARVQHIILSRGLIIRWLGFATIRIGTAAEGGSLLNEIAIPGLLYKNALEIKDVVLARYKTNSINNGRLSGL